MSSAGRDPATIYRRRRLVALAAAVILVLLVYMVGRALFGGGGDDAAGQSAEPPSPAARAFALEQRIRRAARADRQAIQSALQVTPVLKKGEGGKRQVALTFDDGPSAYTPQVLDVLDRYDVKATFFVIGGTNDMHAASIRDLVARGHVVGNHTVGHEALSTLSRRDQAAQIDGETQAIELYGAPKPHLFRPPYNAWNETTLDIVGKRNMLMVLWSVETNDWARPGTDAIVQNVLTAVEPGAIVLMHDGGGDRSQTVDALPRIIEALQADGYEMVTIPQLLRDSPPQQDQR